MQILHRKIFSMWDFPQATENTNSGTWSTSSLPSSNLGDPSIISHAFCFLLLSPSGIFCPFSHTLFLRCHHLGYWALQWDRQSQLEPVVSGMGQLQTLLTEVMPATPHHQQLDMDIKSQLSAGWSVAQLQLTQKQIYICFPTCHTFFALLFCQHDRYYCESNLSISCFPVLRV